VVAQAANSQHEEESSHNTRTPGRKRPGLLCDDALLLVPPLMLSFALAAALCLFAPPPPRVAAQAVVVAGSILKANACVCICRRAACSQAHNKQTQQHSKESSRIEQDRNKQTKRNYTNLCCVREVFVPSSSSPSVSRLLELWWRPYVRSFAFLFVLWGWTFARARSSTLDGSDMSIED
jgi:hypothetical protein